jgi:hypothetical protein
MMTKNLALLTILPLACISLSAASYSTNFPLTENPISEGGNWVVGSMAGGNLWGNVQTTPGLAFGVSEPTTYGDPTAILTGSWGPTQTVQAVVSTTNPTGTCCKEVELRLRVTISTYSITGYEAYCSVMPNNAYCHIAKWNGPNGSYENLADYSGYAANGDVLLATASGTNPTTIKMYKNGTLIMQASDTNSGGIGPWTSGNPGIGFYDNQDNNWSTFGFSSFSASDQTTTSSTAVIGGTVTLHSSGWWPLAGVLIACSDGQQVTTNSNGSYAITVGTPFSGTLTPSLAGYRFSPSQVSVTDVNANVTENFAAKRAR